MNAREFYRKLNKARKLIFVSEYKPDIYGDKTIGRRIESFKITHVKRNELIGRSFSDIYTYFPRKYLYDCYKGKEKGTRIYIA